MIYFHVPQLAESAKTQFSAREYSDHLCLVRAYDGWKDAEKERSGYEYCWRNFLSAQTLKAIDSLRKQFFHLLKDIGIIESEECCNTWSADEHIIRAVICAGLFPAVSFVVVSYLAIYCFLYFVFWGSGLNFLPLKFGTYLVNGCTIFFPHNFFWFEIRVS